jgi:hypothetical protein
MDWTRLPRALLEWKQSKLVVDGEEETPNKK